MRYFGIQTAGVQFAYLRQMLALDRRTQKRAWSLLDSQAKRALGGRGFGFSVRALGALRRGDSWTDAHVESVFLEIDHAGRVIK